jgi:hypothetical protein
VTTASFQVVNYEYYDWSSRENGRSNMILFGAAGELCGVFFEVDEMATLPQPVNNGPNIYQFFYYQSQLDHLIDMVRNETPVFVIFDDEGGLQNSRISTSENPAGEGRQF